MLVIIFSVLLFASVTIAVYAVWGQINTQTDPVTSRLRQLRMMQANIRGGSRVDRPPFLINVIAKLGGFLPAREGRDAMRTGLVRAGFRRPEAVAVFLGCKVLCAAALPAIWIFVGWLAARPIGNVASWTLVSGLVGFYLPTLYIGMRQRRRHASIQSALPDALDLLVICVESGLSVAAGLQRVAGEIRIASRDLSTELTLVHQEMQAGISRADALRNLAHRTGVEEVFLLVAMLIQTDRLGTSIANTLRSHAESMRVRRRQRAEQMARKASIKLAFPLVFLILPALLVVILGPAAIQIMKALVAE